VTWRVVDVTVSTGPDCTAAPRVGVTVVTRTAPGSKTTEPSGSSPVCARPRADSNALIALAVSAVKVSPASPLAYPSAARFAFSSATSRPGDIPAPKGRHAVTVP